jgi:hypothetical protein
MSFQKFTPTNRYSLHSKNVVPKFTIARAKGGTNIFFNKKFENMFHLENYEGVDVFIDSAAKQVGIKLCLKGRGCTRAFNRTIGGGCSIRMSSLGRELNLGIGEQVFSHNPIIDGNGMVIVSYRNIQQTIASKRQVS